MKQYTEMKRKETAKKIKRFIEEIRKMPEMIARFDDMFWNVLA